VHVVATLAPDLHRVAEARGGEQSRSRSLALDERVGGQRRAVDQRAHVGSEAPRVVEHGDHALLHGLRGILGCGEELADLDGAGVVVDPDEIGEGAADVDADASTTRGGGCHGARVSRRSSTVKTGGDCSSSSTVDRALAYSLPRYEETNVPAPARPAKRARRKGARSTGGATPVTRAAITSPTAGASLKPWPDIPAATKKPGSGDSSRMGIQSGVMSKAPAQPRAYRPSASPGRARLVGPGSTSAPAEPGPWAGGHACIRFFGPVARAGE